MRPYGKSSRRCGLTLVEVVAGTAILGTLLVSVLVAAGRLQVQRASSQRHLAACRIADRLLTDWWPDRAKLPRAGGGTIEVEGGVWSWHTTVVANDAAEGLGGEVVRLEVFWQGGSEVPLAGVEVMLAARKDE
jgi:hypothetical protein